MPEPARLGKRAQPGYSNRMWSQPYLETCCRSALHRLALCETPGRPAGLKDGPCLERLQDLGFCTLRPDGRYELTPAGAARHRLEVLNEPLGT